MGRARRAQRPGGSPGVHRAGPAAPLARLLPPLPVAVAAEPAVAGAVRQVARVAACQARGHADTGIPGAAATALTGRLALRVLGWRRSQEDAGDGTRLVPALSRLSMSDMYLENR